MKEWWGWSGATRIRPYSCGFTVGRERSHEIVGKFQKSQYHPLGAFPIRYGSALTKIARRALWDPLYAVLPFPGSFGDRAGGM
jgi:hypothetical protein